MVIDQPNLQQLIERTARGSKMTAEVSAGSVTDAEFLDQRGIVQSALLQVVRGFRMAVQLKLIKSGRLLQ